MRVAAGAAERRLARQSASGSTPTCHQDDGALAQQPIPGWGGVEPIQVQALIAHVESVKWIRDPHAVALEREPLGVEAVGEDGPARSESHCAVPDPVARPALR